MLVIKKGNAIDISCVIYSPNTADFVIFAEEIPNGKLHFWCSDNCLRLLDVHIERQIFAYNGTFLGKELTVLTIFAKIFVIVV